MSCWRRSPTKPLSTTASTSPNTKRRNNSLKTTTSRSPSPQIKRITAALFGGGGGTTTAQSSETLSEENPHLYEKTNMGKSCSYDLTHIPDEDDDCFLHLPQDTLHHKLYNNNNTHPQFKQMAEPSDELNSASPVLNGQSLGILNSPQPTGNVQSKAAAFSRLNASSQSQQQTVNSSSRRVVSSGLSSFHHQHQHQSNELQSSSVKQSQHVKSNLSEMQSSMQSRMKALSQQSTSTSSSTASTTSSSVNSTSSKGLKMGLTPLKLTPSFSGENNNNTPLDTGTVLVQEIPFPSAGEIVQMTPVLHVGVGDMPSSPLSSPNLVLDNHPIALCPPPGSAGVANGKDGSQSFHFQQKKVASSSSSMFRSGNYSTEQASANAAEMKRVQTGDITYEENSHAAARKEKVEVDGVTAEKKAATLQEQRSLTQAGVTDEETRRAAAASLTVSTGVYTAEKVAAMAETNQTRSAQGKVFKSQNHIAGLTQSKLTFKNQLPSGETEDVIIFDDLNSLGWSSLSHDVGRVTDKYATELSSIVEDLRECDEDDESVDRLNYASGVMRAAWKVPGHGHQVGKSLSKTFREMGGLDILIGNFSSRKVDLRIASARLLEQSLTPENCNYVVEKGFDCLDKVVKVASDMCEVEESRVGTGLFRHLFRHSESTCSDVLRLQGLERVMAECRRMDVETLRNCAGALVNLSLYGGAENQEAMIKRKVHLWLFPLAFHHDDTIKYYACLAISVLVANKEIEAQIIKSNTLQLVEPFLLTHNPEEFAASNYSHGQGQSCQWLEKLVPVLSSQREEARSLAAFHFCMEAGIKKRQNMTHIFKQINAIEALKRVASSPNALASKLAAQALKLIGEEVPHKLSQQVPLWSIEDVREWVIQKGFQDYADSFMASRVDGDLLLQLTEDMLSSDIKMENGILRKRFMRDLWHLKKMADYSCCDTTNLNDYLSSIQPEFCAYTYTLLNNGVDKETLRKCVSDEMLGECGVSSSMHRGRILDALREKSDLSSISEENLDKPLDVFISYRRSNGSQLASLLKVHLALRGFSVFIDVERLEAGKFDNNLLQSITQAKHFVLVLTPDALDRCIGDSDCKDWIHREIVAALQSQCNIVPIMDQYFQWPECDKLPEDMQPVHTFNGIKWIHDYQDACVDKIERFLRGEQIPRDPVQNVNALTTPSGQLPNSGGTTPRISQQYMRTTSGGSESKIEEVK